MRNLFGGLLCLISSFIFAQTGSYEQEITAWRAKRLNSLRSETGWLNLAGLFWLKDGANSIGGAESNDCVFPTNHAAPSLGKIVLKEGKVFLEDVPQGVSITVKGQPFLGGLIFSEQEESLVLSHQSLRWFIIKRGEKYAIRLRDLEGEYVKNFKGIENFLTQEKWKLKGKFVASPGKKLKIVDVTGRVYEEESPGKVEFTIGKKSYSLAATQEGNELFIVFGDLTNKHETYGGGRFMYIDMPKKGTDEVVIDFNKAFNPPCVFTPYATCPLPVTENKLQVKIPAGEKYTSHY